MNKTWKIKYSYIGETTEREAQHKIKARNENEATKKATKIMSGRGAQWRLIEEGKEVIQ